MTEVRTNPIINLPQETRLFLENNMRKELSNEQILRILETKFGWVKGVTLKDVEEYRLKIYPGYKQQLKKEVLSFAKLEADILAEIQKPEIVIEGDEDFSEDEQRKVNQIRAHRKLLKELYDGYLKLRSTKEETAKLKYLYQLSAELVIVAGLEASEKSFLSALEEVRKAELKETPDQKFESIISWSIPRLSERCKDLNEASMFMWRTQLFLNEYMKILLESPNAVDANRTLLERIFVKKK